MSDKATLTVNGSSYDFPIIKGSEDELAIDIKALRGSTGGVITCLLYTSPSPRDA